MQSDASSSNDERIGRPCRELSATRNRVLDCTSARREVKRKGERDVRPAAELAVDPDLASMIGHDLVRDRQPEPGPHTDATRGESRVEHAAEILRCDAAAVVLDLDDRPHLALAGPDPDRAAISDRLPSISDDVEKH